MRRQSADSHSVLSPVARVVIGEIAVRVGEEGWNHYEPYGAQASQLNGRESPLDRAGDAGSSHGDGPQARRWK